MEIEVKILRVGKVEQIKDNFKKRVLEVEVDYEGNYPQPREFELINDQVSLADGLFAGQIVTLCYNMKGKKMTDKSGKERIQNRDQVWKIK